VNEKVAAQIETVHDCLLARYPGSFHRRVAVREFLTRICARHIESGLGDPNLAAELCSKDDARYWQRLSEVLLANEILDVGLALTPSRKGPDFLIEVDGRKVWIEVICPQPTGVPEDWLAQPTGQAVGFPHEALLLRWTAAIKEKAEKLLGNPTTATRGYVDKRIVNANDAYVIAVNARLLRGPHFATITGISQFPFAVEAAFAVGPITIIINRDTMAQAGSGHAHRPVIQKPNGSAVPAYTFLDTAFRPVSAIWATDVDETWVIGNMKPMAVIHNPIAVNPIPPGLLPAHDEFIATPDGNEYVLERRDGRLIQRS
jgi:hypothetical protein